MRRDPNHVVFVPEKRSRLGVAAPATSAGTPTQGAAEEGVGMRISSMSTSETGTGRLLMMCWKSLLVMKCLFNLYFFARKSVGKGSVPQMI